MKIYFSPAYKGHLYIDFGRFQNGVAFDTCYKNTDGLYELLATHLGVHLLEYPEVERLVAYFEALSAYVKDYPHCIIAESFANAPLSTTKECLRWRDELALYGWSEDTPAVSIRLALLNGIEVRFKLPKGKGGKAAFRNQVLDALEKNPTVLKGSVIYVPFPKHVLQPQVQYLLDILSKGGCEVHYDEREYYYERLLKSDGGFEVWEFETTQEAMRYLATLPKDYADCYIHSDSTTLDSWMHLCDGVTSGSSVTNNNPGSCALFVLGLKTRFQTLDIVSLVEWLSLPNHPLSFSRILANKIADTGGYHNIECKDLLDSFKDKGSEIACWLPKIDLEIDKSVQIQINKDENRKKEKKVVKEEVAVEDLRVFTKALYKWAKKKWRIWKDQVDQSPTTVTDLPNDWSDIIDLCENFTRILEHYPDNKIRRETVEELAFALVPVNETSLHQACVGSKEVISSPGCMADDADKTMVCDAYGECPTSLSCDFLSEKERKCLSMYIQLWNRGEERDYQTRLLMFPLTHTKKKLILVTCNKDGIRPLNKHPLIIWAQGRLGPNYNEYVKHLSIGSNYLVDKDIVNNDTSGNEIKLTKNQNLHWRKEESPTSLEKLLNSPLDYALDHLAWIKSSSKDSNSKISTIEGNVAHQTIEMLFNPREDGITVDGKVLRERFKKEYDSVIKKALNSRGAILLMKENNIKHREFIKDLHRCIDSLIEIIEKNSLEVVACEYQLQNIDLGLTRGCVSQAPDPNNLYNKRSKRESGDITYGNTDLEKEHQTKRADHEVETDLYSLPQDNESKGCTLEDLKDTKVTTDSNSGKVNADNVSIGINRIDQTEEQIEDTDRSNMMQGEIKIPVNGRIDMVLKDPKGEKVIIDLKWSEYYKADEEYKDKLKNGKAFQLDLYCMMLPLHDKSIVTKTGYFLMPKGVLFTRESFAGNHIYKVKADPVEDAVKTIRDNHALRMKEFSDGIITFKDQAGNTLRNNFSTYTLFYGQQ